MQAKKLPYQEYTSIYSKVPRLCVDLVIQTADGILLIQRDIPPGKGLWHFPGGTILLGESIQEAANRICRDETGLDLQIGTLIDKKSELLQLPNSESNMAFFHQLPDKIIPEHKRLLLKHGIIAIKRVD